MPANWRLALIISILISSSSSVGAIASESFSLAPISANSPLSTKSLNAKVLNSTAGSSFLAQSVNAEPAKTAQKAGALSGKITDLPKEHGVKDARVVLSKVGEEHKRYHTETKPDGSYAFADVEPGDYDFTVSAAEMLSTNQKVVIAPGEAKVLDIAMEDLEPVETLRITGKRTLIHPESIGAETNIDHRTIYQYKSGNDLRQLIESTPGVMNDSYGNVITRGEHNAINYELDGVVIPEAAGVLQQTQPVSPRSLQNIKVDIGGYEAQDGGGPLGAVAHMRSLPIDAKPNFLIGQQIGGPIAGNIYYNTSGAFSENPDSKLYNLRFSSSGQFRGTSLRLAPGTKDFVGNAGADINSLSSLVWKPNNKDTFKFDLAINESFLQSPISKFSRNAGVHSFQQDRQDYFITSWKRKGERFFDELNLHLLNGFYAESFKSSPAFDPAPVLNADQPIQSLSATARRFNYVFSAQGDISKTAFKSHHFKAGFLSEIRPVRTKFGATYFNADLPGTLATNAQAADQVAQLQAAGDFIGASQVNLNPVPFGAPISPFTGTPDGPQFRGSTYKGFRWLQSAYLQDKWTPKSSNFWKRLTLDGGVRFDLQHSVFGNTQALADQVASIPGVQPFDRKPFNTQRATDAQASGRYGASFVVTKNTVVRASYSDIFTPTPVDTLIAPFLVSGVDPIGGIYPGTPRPLRATRGRLVDFSIEQQIGPRFVTRTNLFYKELKNFGDSGVISNLPIYNRLTNSGQEAYGVETRVDMKPKRDGYGFNGFLSSTVQAAYLRGTHGVSGGFYDFPEPPLPRYPDHDRRFQGTAGLGYKGRANWWVLGDAQVSTGLQDQRDVALSGPHPSRTPVITNLGLSAGYNSSLALRKQYRFMPASFDLRIENLLNQRYATNLGSPFQGTRYMLPLRVLAGCAWQFGHEPSQVAAKPSSKPSTQI